MGFMSVSISAGDLFSAWLCEFFHPWHESEAPRLSRLCHLSGCAPRWPRGEHDETEGVFRGRELLGEMPPRLFLTFFADGRSTRQVGVSLRYQEFLKCVSAK